MAGPPGIVARTVPRIRPGAAAVATLVAAVAALAFPGSSVASQPWRAAEEIRASLFAAQSALLLGEARSAPIAPAERALAGSLERELRRAEPASLWTLERSLAAARRAFAAGDETALAAARGQAVASLRRGAFALTVAAREKRGRPRGAQLAARQGLPRRHALHPAGGRRHRGAGRARGR